MRPGVWRNRELPASERVVPLVAERDAVLYGIVARGHRWHQLIEA